MLVRAVVGVVVATMAAATLNSRSSDPLVEGLESLPQLDPSLSQVPLGYPDTMESDIPGAPLSPDDFREGSEMIHKDYDPSSKADPIELAGLFQGDIFIPTADEYMDMMRPAAMPQARNAMKNIQRLWDNGVIPYVISSSYSKPERGTIAMAMAKYHNNTCLRFVPRTVEKDYIHIFKGDGCSSSVGKSGGAQGVSLGPGCLYVGIVMHEFMHAAGFWHEQSRADRDNFITINTPNIQKGMEYNFEKYSWDKIQTLDVGYDLDSVMHYGPYAFAKDRTIATIIPRMTGIEIGQRRDFSPKDVLKLMRLYNCATTNAIITEAPISVTGPVPEPCKDYNKYCKTWAAMKECATNPSWMNDNCKMSCKQCGIECSDNNEHCGFWATKGECITNPDYMSRICKKSCGVCHNAADFNQNMCDDHNRHCKAWSDSGNCRSNPNYMLLWCRKSCAKC